MEQIILNTNLRFVIAGLDAKEKGALLQALLDGTGEALMGEVLNIYRYIMALQEEAASRKRRMRELSAKAAAMRKKAVAGDMEDLFGENDASVTDGAPTVTGGDKERKEAKERNYNKIKKLFISSDEKKKEVEEKKSLKARRVVKEFVPPLVSDVREVVEAEKLLVDPETFVDFYDSRGWKMGATPIKNWKATLKLWHRRRVREGGGCSIGVTLGGDDVVDCHSDESSGNDGASGTGMTLAVVGGESGTQHVGSQAMTAYGGRKKLEDETYWHELIEKTCAARDSPLSDEKKEGEAGVVEGDSEHEQDDRTELSPFARFMRRIEDNDI